MKVKDSWLIIPLIAIIFLLNLSIASRSPYGGWMDEVVFVDPAFNLAAGKGWTSSAWLWQTDHEFWAVNSPLYSGGLFAWIQLFGASMVTARAYCYFLAAIGIFLFWLGAFRFQILTPLYRLFWVVILSTQYAMNWMERNERYDVWIFIGLGIAWAGALVKSFPAKVIAVMAGGFLVPWGGLVGAPYVCFLALLATVLTSFRFWKESLAAVVGMAAGVISVFAFYAKVGHLDAFLTSVHHNSGLGDRPFYAHVRDLLLYPQQDISLWAIIGVLVALTFFFFFQKGHAGASPWLQLGWAAVVLMPCVMILRGIFSMVYFYMVIIPLSLALLQLILHARSEAWGRALAFALSLVIGLDCLMGLPARLFFAYRDWDYRSPKHMTDFVHRYIRPDDSVESDYAFYFVLKDYVKFVASPHYLAVIPPDEASRVTVALVRNGSMPDMVTTSALKGTWTKVAVFPTPEMTAQDKPANADLTFTLYRREVPHS